MPHPDAYGDPTTIRVGDVVFIEGASALLGDVVRVDRDEDEYEVCWRRTFSTEVHEDLVLANERPRSPAERLDGAIELLEAVKAELGPGGPTDDLDRAHALIMVVARKLRSYADDDE